MKITVFLFFFGLINLVAGPTYSQNTKISLNMKDASVESVLNKIEEVSEFYFLFNHKLINVERKVDVTAEEEPIKDILSEILPSDVRFIVSDRQIVLTPAQGSPALEALMQQQTVSGKVIDASTSEAMTGVNIQVKGTSLGAITDAAGRYSLSVPERNATLIFSFIGYVMQEVPLNGRTTLDLVLQPELTSLDEVVVIGYGTIRKSDLTGSVASVKFKDELNELSNVSVIQSLRSTVPGLNIGAIDRPGQNPSLDIRGQSTLSSSAEDNAPLIVVDGTIYRGSLIDLNPNDIESIDVLKDASSAAIYGSQASNGVMIITTKTGANVISKPIISYSGSYTIETPSNVLTPMKAKEYEKFFRDATWLNSRLGPDYLQDNPNYNITQFMKTNEIVQGYLDGLDTDWWGGLTRNGSIHSHDLSIRGKNDDINYFISAGYTKNVGFLINDDYGRYNMRINLDAKINNWMNVGIESFYTSSDYSGYSPSITTAFLLQPWAPIYDENGQFILKPEGSWLNPYAQLQTKDSEKTQNLFGNVHANINLPVKGLTYRFNFMQNYRTSNHYQYDPWGENYTGVGYKNTDVVYDWQADNIINYQRKFNVHSINATLVYGVEKVTGDNTNSSARAFTNGSLGYNSLQAGTATLNSINTGAWEETSLYSMGRILYNFNDKYLFTATVRRDGFSGFGTEKKIGIFPSFALAWVVSEESFLDKTDWLENLKIRGSYGSTGRRGVSRYQTLARMSRTNSYIFGEGGSTVIGQWISSMANNELGWETTTGLNLGIDFSVMNKRLFGNFEYYNNNTKNILYNIQLPQMTGFSSIATNIGKVHNSGFEFSITGNILRTNDISWITTINYARNRNKIVSILGFDNDKDGKEDNLVANRLFIGEPQRVIYDYEIIGMWQFADQTAGNIPSGFFPGSYKIADLNNDGAYSASTDMKILGYADPSYQISLVNNINYKRFGFYMVINSIQGGKNYYMGNDDPTKGGLNWANVEQFKYCNVPTGAWDYWMPENPDAKYRRLDIPSSYEPPIYSQRNFIRLQDITLSYTFNETLINKYDIGSFKVFLSGKNLVTITKWKGLDPETGSEFEPGFPLMKSYTLGVNVEF